MKIRIQGTNMELTLPIREYAEKKILSLEKFCDKIITADIDVGMNSKHHLKGDVYYAEVNLGVPGKLIRVVKEGSDLYKAIDKVKDHLKVELQKMKEKSVRRDKKVLREQKAY